LKEKLRSSENVAKEQKDLIDHLHKVIEGEGKFEELHSDLKIKLDV
jgi:hypothetical protein